MAIQLSGVVRNARLDQIETTVSTIPVLRIRTGAAPASCGAADSGTILASVNLPSDWLVAATNGSITKNGTWQTTSAENTGGSGHFRIYASNGTTTHLQGTVTATGGGGDMTLDSSSANIAAGQTVTINTFALTDGNA